MYLRIVAIGFVPSLIYNFGSAILRAKGKEKNADSIKNRAIVMGYYRSVFYNSFAYFDGAMPYFFLNARLK